MAPKVNGVPGAGEGALKAYVVPAAGGAPKADVVPAGGASNTEDLDCTSSTWFTVGAVSAALVTVAVVVLEGEVGTPQSNGFATNSSNFNNASTDGVEEGSAGRPLGPTKGLSNEEVSGPNEFSLPEEGPMAIVRRGRAPALTPTGSFSVEYTLGGRESRAEAAPTGETPKVNKGPTGGAPKRDGVLLSGAPNAEGAPAGGASVERATKADVAPAGGVPTVDVIRTEGASKSDGMPSGAPKEKVLPDGEADGFLPVPPFALECLLLADLFWLLLATKPGEVLKAEAPPTVPKVNGFSIAGNSVWFVWSFGNCDGVKDVDAENGGVPGGAFIVLVIVSIRYGLE